FSEDDVDNEDEEESSDSEEEEEEHLAPTVPTPAQYSSVSESDKTEPFEEGETTATPPPFGYRIAARISVQPHILMPFRSESERARFTTPTSRYEIGESFVAAAARQIRPTLTIAESRRADGKLIGRLRRERLLPVTRGPYEYISDTDGGFAEGGQYPTEAAYRARSEGCCTEDGDSCS
nr:hypothetical protein [Tanacetum cinerariifolium]